MTSEIMLAIK